MPLLHLRPKRHIDGRGWFAETWNRERFRSHGIDCDFCQDNHSLSARRGTLRGLHFQRAPFAQAKLVRCLRGSIFDVAVDVRRDSPTFGKWIGVELTAEQGNQLFIPAGFAHGFLTLEDECEVAYKVDAYYAPEADGGLAWNDPRVGIAWPDTASPLRLSDKDAELPTIDVADFDFDYDGHPLALIECN